MTKLVPFPHSHPTTALGFGCAYLTAGWEMNRSQRLLHTAYDAGYRHFDVAPTYGIGTAEDAVGAGLRGRRQDVTLVTKVGLLRPRLSVKTQAIRWAATPVRRLAGPLLRARERLGASVSSPARETDFTPMAVLTSLEESLRRLQTDYLDALLLHEVRQEDITEELLTCLDEIRRSGRARAIGLASDYQQTIAITAAAPGFFDLCQYARSPLEKLNESDGLPSYRITHRAIMLGLPSLRQWFDQHPDLATRAKAEVGCDLGEDAALSKALLGAAMANNPGGIVLAASRRADRIVANAGALHDARWADIGLRLTQFLDGKFV